MFGAVVDGHAVFGDDFPLVRAGTLFVFHVPAETLQKHIDELSTAVGFVKFFRKVIGFVLVEEPG